MAVSLIVRVRIQVMTYAKFYLFLLYTTIPDPLFHEPEKNR